MQQKACLGRFRHLGAVLMIRNRKSLELKRSNSILLNQLRGDEFSVMNLAILPPVSLDRIQRDVCITICQQLTWRWSDGWKGKPSTWDAVSALPQL